jgi:hypothetical protein
MGASTPDQGGVARARSVTPLEWMVLGAALAPVVVAVGRAALRHWMPVGDAAYFTVRSRDVLTSHHPLLGAWSSGSSVVGLPVNNLGPLQLDLLAPFTKVSPYLGTGIGAAVLDGASIVLVWVAVRRLFGPWCVAGVMAGTLALVATLGLSWLVDARQQYALVLPLYALCWLVASMAAGWDAAVPLAVAVASVIVQTHFTYVYPALLLGAFGVVSYAVATRHRRPRRWGRIGLVGVVVGALCWAQPLVDEVWGTGNLGTVLGPARRGETGAGLRIGAQVVAGAVLTPPFWLPGSIGGFLRPYDGVSLPVAVIVLIAWLAAASGVAWWACRRGDRRAGAVAATATAALVAALAGASLVPVSAFGLVPQNYLWLWAIGAFVTVGLGVALATLDPVRDRLARLGRRRLHVVAIGFVVVVAAAALWPRYPVASVAEDEDEARRVGRPLREQMAGAFGSGAVGDEVEVDLSRAFFANDYPFVMLTELQRAGVEFRFAAGSRNLDRFGESRCVAPGVLPRLFLVPGADPELEPGSQVIAAVAGIDQAELDEYHALQVEFGERLRSGDVTVDVASVRSTFGDAVAGQLDDLATVRATRGAPAAGLARSLHEWRLWGYVEVAADARGAFDRWYDLERRSSADYQSVVLVPPGVAPTADPTARC